MGVRAAGGRSFVPDTLWLYLDRTHDFQLMPLA